MTGLVNAAIDAATHVFDERAEDTPVQRGDDEVTVDDDA
jgi:hypothetical protein